MKKFVVLYYAPTEAVETMKNATPEEMEKGMEPWMAWVEKCGSGLVDLGAPLGNGQHVSKSGSTASQTQVTGYSILQASDMESAKKMLEGHPHLEWAAGCSIEIHEAMPLPE